MTMRFIIMAMLATGFAGVASAADINGDWARTDGNSRVRIAGCGGNICATNTWIRPGTPSEKAGDVLVMTIKPDTDGQYSGSAFDPQRHLSYRMSLALKNDTLTSRGCVLGGLLCKNVSWTRVK